MVLERYWTSDEDDRLRREVAANGPHKWGRVAANACLNRNAGSCRLRWVDHLDPDLKRGDFTDEEQLLILLLHSLLGYGWSQIAKKLPGRTDNKIKNFWNTHMNKEAKRLNFKEFLQLMTERLVERIKAPTLTLISLTAYLEFIRLLKGVSAAEAAAVVVAAPSSAGGTTMASSSTTLVDSVASDYSVDSVLTAETPHRTQPQPQLHQNDFHHPLWSSDAVASDYLAYNVQSAETTYWTQPQPQQQLFLLTAETPQWTQPQQLLFQQNDILHPLWSSDAVASDYSFDPGFDHGPRRSHHNDLATNVQSMMGLPTAAIPHLLQPQQNEFLDIIWSSDIFPNNVQPMMDLPTVEIPHGAQIPLHQENMLPTMEIPQGDQFMPLQQQFLEAPQLEQLFDNAGFNPAEEPTDFNISLEQVERVALDEIGCPYHAELDGSGSNYYFW